MGLFKAVNGAMNALVDKMVFGERAMSSIDGPTFIKDFSKDNSQLKDLEELCEKLMDGDKRKNVVKDIYALKQGLNGENNVYYELKSSGIPMYCMHDIRLEYGGLSAQIDFVVITKQCFYIIETKNLYGNIEITAEGEFIRWNKSSNGRTFREGMYSPVEQNKKHINMIKNILVKEFNIKRMPVKSMVVMANPKAIINKAKCPEELKNVVIRHEQIAKYIECAIKDTDYSLDEDRVKEIGEYMVKNNNPITFDYEAKYCLTKDDYCTSLNNEENIKVKELEIPKNEVYENEVKSKLDQHKVIEAKDSEQKNSDTALNCVSERSKDDAELFEKLRLFRNSKAKEEGYDFRHYHFVFPNSVIEQLVTNKPTSVSELFKIKGLGQVKIDKYGEGIIKTINY